MSSCRLDNGCKMTMHRRSNGLATWSTMFPMCGMRCKRRKCRYLRFGVCGYENEPPLEKSLGCCRLAIVQRGRSSGGGKEVTCDAYRLGRQSAWS